MWNIIEIMVNCFQAWMMLLFMRSRVHLKKRGCAKDILFCICITAAMSVSLFTEVYIPDILIFLLPLLYALLYAKDPWYADVFWAVVLTLLFLTVVSLVLHIFLTIPDVSYDTIMNTGSVRLLFIGSTNGMLLTTILILRRMRKVYTPEYWPVLILFLLVIASLFVIEEALYSLQLSVEVADKPAAPFLWAYIALLCAVLLSALLFHRMSCSLEKENRNKMILSALEKNRSYVQELSLMYEKLQVLKHDMKHHYQVLEEMAIQGNSEQARDYYRQFQQKTEEEEYHLTGSCAVDALLLAKTSTMEQNGLQFQFSPYPLYEMPMPEIDFCAMIGNVLDNAIEGALRLKRGNEKPVIQLSFSRSWDMFYIICKNPCDITTIQRNHLGWISSKGTEGAPRPATGIHSVERIVERADGKCEIGIENGCFTVKIVLPFEDSAPSEETAEN